MMSDFQMRPEYFIFLMFIYLFLREKEHASRGGAEKRRDTNGQSAYKKMLSIISHEVNANQYHNEASLHTHWDDYSQKDQQ